MGPLARSATAVAAAGTACVAYGTFIERRWYRLREVALPGALRPQATGALRILHLSDLHLDPPQAHKVRFVQALAAQHYDLVVVTGDLLGAVRAEDEAAALMATLTADGTPGLVVLGSNDLFAPTLKSPHRYLTDPDYRSHGEALDLDRLVDGLQTAGYQVLRNARTVVSTRHGAVAAGGIDDPHLQDTLLPDLAEVAVDDGSGAALHLGVVHAPYTAALDLLVAAGHDLLLAGHTHGGQVRFPPIGAVVGNCDLPLGQIRGASRYRDRWLHISPGLGTSRYAPFRFACRPEATILHCTA